MTDRKKKTGYQWSFLTIQNINSYRKLISKPVTNTCQYILCHGKGTLLFPRDGPIWNKLFQVIFKP